MFSRIVQQQAGFTLIELLVTIGIISVLATVLLIAINPLEQLARGRDAGRLSSVKQLGQALQRNASLNGGTYPALVAGWQTNILKPLGEISNVITVPIVGSSTCGGASSMEGNICYNSSSIDAIVWTPAESRNYTTIAGCGSTQTSIVAWIASQGTGMSCFPSVATVPTPDPINNTFDTIPLYTLSRPNSSPTPTSSAPTATPTPTPTPLPVIAQDTFIRTNYSPGWGPATDSHVWAQDAGNDPNFSVTANTAQDITVAGIIKYGTLGGTAANSQVIFTGSTNNFSNSDYGAVLRFSDKNNWYKAYIDGSNLLIRRMLTGNNSILTQASFAALSNTSYTVKFQAIGSTLQAKAWPSSGTEPGSWMVSTTDGNFGSGNAGLSIWGNGGIVTFTSFTANQL